MIQVLLDSLIQAFPDKLFNFLEMLFKIFYFYPLAQTNKPCIMHFLNPGEMIMARAADPKLKKLKQDVDTAKKTLKDADKALKQYQKEAKKALKVKKVKKTKTSKKKVSKKSAAKSAKKKVSKKKVAKRKTTKK